MLFLASPVCIGLFFFPAFILFYFSEPCEPSHPMPVAAIQLSKRPRCMSAAVPNDMGNGIPFSNKTRNRSQQRGIGGIDAEDGRIRNNEVKGDGGGCGFADLRICGFTGTRAEVFGNWETEKSVKSCLTMPAPRKRERWSVIYTEYDLG